MKGPKPFLSLIFGCLVCAVLSGCAGSVPQNGPGALTIAQFSLSQGVPGVAYRQLLIASGGKQPYTWSISAGNLPPGLTLTSDGIISGTPTTTGSSDFTVMVTDSQTPTKAVDTAPLSIMINPPLSLVTTPLTSGIVGANYSATLSASNGVAPYTYTVAAGSLPPCAPTPPCSPNLTLTTNVQPVGGGANPATIGGLVSTGNNNNSAESPTQAGVFNFIIQATDSLGEVATASYSITVTGPLQGNYAITFNGFSHGLPFYLVGEINAASGQNMNGTIVGNITGIIDQNGPNGLSTALPITGSYSLPIGTNLGTITLESSTLGRYVYSIALSTISDSPLILVNDNMYGSGLLKKQPAVLALPDNGANYTFGVFGNDPSGNRYAGAGTFSMSPSDMVTGGEQDTNDNGTISNGPVAITGGNLVPDASNPGRGVATLTTASGTATYTYYIASLTELVAVRTDNGAMTIADIQQQSSTGITGQLTLCKAGSTCQSVVELDGVATSGSGSVPIAALGVVAYDGSGNIAGPSGSGVPGYYTDQSIGGAWSPASYTSGTYTTDSLGRVTVNLQGATSQPVWYLVGSGQAFVMGTDATVMQGTLQVQTIPTAGSFTGGSFIGYYLGGTATPTLASVTNEIDVAFTPPPGGIFVQMYETNGPGSGEPLTTAATFTGGYVLDPTYGPPYGRFAICAVNASEYCTGSTEFTYDPNNPPVDIFYIVGAGSAGVTGGKIGVASLNFGLVQQDQSTIVDPNPRVSAYGR